MIAFPMAWRGNARSVLVTLDAVSTSPLEDMVSDGERSEGADSVVGLTRR